MKNKESGIVYISSILIMLIRLVQGDYLAMVSSSGTNLLVWVADNGTVTNVGATPYVNTPSTIIAQYQFSEQTYYALHDSKYLFSYSPTSESNNTLLLQVPEESLLVSMCVSQQFGTVYAIQVTTPPSPASPSACLVEINEDTGTFSAVASPFTIDTNTEVGQCIVDDDFSRVVWTYKNNSATPVTSSILSTDLLPQGDGETATLYTDTTNIWLFYNWNSATFYATTIVQQHPQLSLLSIAVDGVKKTVLIPTVGVIMAAAQGALNTQSGIISIFGNGFIEQINIANATYVRINMLWPSGPMTIYPMSAAWVPQDK